MHAKRLHLSFFGICFYLLLSCSLQMTSCVLMFVVLIKAAHPSTRRFFTHISLRCMERKGETMNCFWNQMAISGLSDWVMACFSFGRALVFINFHLSPCQTNTRPVCDGCTSRQSCCTHRKKATLPLFCSSSPCLMRNVRFPFKVAAGSNPYFKRTCIGKSILLFIFTKHMRFAKRIPKDMQRKFEGSTWVWLRFLLRALDERFDATMFRSRNKAIFTPSIKLSRFLSQPHV